MNPISNAQIRRIQTLARNVGFTEDMRRAFIAREAGGKTSTKQLTIAEAVRVIDGLQALPGANAKPAAPKARGAVDLHGRYIGVVRALWISGFHLGIVRDRTDKAMCAFIERQTGLGHANWLNDPKDSRKVIEALKKWLERAAGVAWKDEEPDALTPDDRGLGRKRAVYLAIRRKLTAAGIDPLFNAFPGRIGAVSLDASRLDTLIAKGGELLRRKAG